MTTHLNTRNAFWRPEVCRQDAGRAVLSLKALGKAAPHAFLLGSGGRPPTVSRVLGS